MPRRPLTPDGFMRRVDSSGDCWLWMGQRDSNGYGRLSGRMAHRVGWVLFGKELPSPGMHFDHLCRTRACVNPDHLEPVTPLENQRRSAAATKTHCVHGHEYTPENTYLRPVRGRGMRDCRTCFRERTRRYRERKAA
jgi:hypothetical protein